MRARLFGAPLRLPALPPELLFNRLDREVHDGDVVRYAVQLEPAVKLFRGSSRQLRPQAPSPLANYAALVFENPAARPGPRRRLRRRRTTLVFGVAEAAFFRASFAATAFGGRPGPPGRHVPRRRRPLVAGFRGERVLSSDWIAERTSCCTRLRITVTRLRCRGIDSSLPVPDTRRTDYQQSRRLSDRSGRGGRTPARR